MSDFDSLAQIVINGDFVGAKNLTQKMIDNGVDPLEIINQGLMAGMNVDRKAHV